jgi:hypothetical protein
MDNGLRFAACSLLPSPEKVARCTCIEPDEGATPHLTLRSARVTLSRKGRGIAATKGRGNKRSDPP